MAASAVVLVVTLLLSLVVLGLLLDVPSALVGGDGSAVLGASAAAAGGVVGNDTTFVVLIDALRPDMLLSRNGFPFFNQLLEQRRAAVVSPIAKSPTVTLPKLKTIVTGKEAQFLDMVRNFAADSLRESNFVSKISSRKRRAVFYGDDTWLKLFPSCPRTVRGGSSPLRSCSEGPFYRSEGVFSFDVTDYTEIDLNVTRNLCAEAGYAVLPGLTLCPLLGHTGSLTKVDDRLSRVPILDDRVGLVVLHYLGLDHIGHVMGPDSPEMLRKQREMDNVIQFIYNQFVRSSGSRAHLVVLSDHGMAARGGHGGSSSLETHTVMALLTRKTLFRGSEMLPPCVSRYAVPNPNNTAELEECDQTVVASVLSSLLGLGSPSLCSLWSPAGPVVHQLPPWSLFHALCRISMARSETEASTQSALLTMMHPHAPPASHPYTNESDMYCAALSNRRPAANPDASTSVGTAVLTVVFAFGCGAIAWRMAIVSRQLITLALLFHAAMCLSSSFAEEEHLIVYYAFATSLVAALWSAPCSPAFLKRRILYGSVALVAARISFGFTHSGDKYKLSSQPPPTVLAWMLSNSLCKANEWCASERATLLTLAAHPYSIHALAGVCVAAIALLRSSARPLHQSSLGVRRG